MTRFMFIYAAFIFALDAIVLAWADILFLLLLLPAALFFYTGLKVGKKRKDLKVNSGLLLGGGVDIDNPETPRKTTVILEEKALDLGFLAIGGPGSGKSIGTVVTINYFSNTRKIGWVYWEGKGDKDIYQVLCASGAKPDKFFSSELPDCDTTNVVSGSIDAVIEALTQTLITSENDYYRNAQREALRAVVPLLKKIGQPIILRDIYVALKVEDAAQYVLNLARERGVAFDVIEVARQFFSKPPEEIANNVNGLLTKMSMFCTGDVAERLNDYTPTLDFVEASKKGQKVYLHMPYSSMAKDIAIMFTEQIGVIAKNRQLFDDVRTPWPQMFDDWGAFFYPNIGPITARCRSAKMPVSFMFQSKGQTDRVDMAGIFTTEVTDNIGGFISFRINGNDTAQWVADQFGTFESTELSASDNGKGQGQNVTTSEKPRVKGNELKNMDAGEAVISCLVSGEKGKSQNKLYKARFPYPAMLEDPKKIQWPKIEKENTEHDGLNLWDKFMNKNKVEQLKQEVAEFALQKAARKIAKLEVYNDI
jgi:TraM recognition site of TraD and TraG